MRENDGDIHYEIPLRLPGDYRLVLKFIDVSKTNNFPLSFIIISDNAI